MEQPNKKAGNAKERDVNMDDADFLDQADLEAECHGTFVPHPYELAVLARHYADCSFERKAEWELFRQAGGGANAVWWHRRLRTIEVILGKERMAQVLAPVRDHWDRIFADADALANRHGVQYLSELPEGDPEADALAARCGLVAIPLNKLHPMSSFVP